ncbi:hypothetical protein LTR84_008042 [Exophiala bonariae]|uniref:Glycoside hydrolase family 43 protein n=1 Tax=Exophiala bonariae TaxID=1690606 RepID=A0AAV9NMT7_9EURO|nr:hypothetical protein LTR84_008042 [Exophiala bonariae]
MVAIPTYLLASSAISHLGSLVSRDPVPVPAPHPDSSSNSASSSTAFGSVLGPLISSQFADPAIIHVDGTSYAFATNNRGVGSDLVHVQVATSTDNHTWTLLEHHDALPQVGAWETGVRVWAPDVVQLDDGSFVLYYTDEVATSRSHHCIGAATSKSVLGPYTPLDQPLACPDVHKLGGAIDPDGFYDPSTHKRYVLYKTDGNSLGHGGTCSNTIAPIMPTPIMLQEVSMHDGITLIGNAVQLLDRDVTDGPLIEAPSLHRSCEGIYFLFYSSNCFTTPMYDVAYATATNINGPYTRSNHPLLITSDSNLVGPGGLDIIRGGDMVVFHSHLTVDNDPAMKKKAEKISHDTNTPLADVKLPLVRGLWTAKATFSGDTVSLA